MNRKEIIEKLKQPFRYGERVDTENELRYSYQTPDSHGELVRDCEDRKDFIGWQYKNGERSAIFGGYRKIGSGVLMHDLTFSEDMSKWEYEVPTDAIFKKGGE